MADNFRTGTCTTSTFDYAGGHPHWFIENTSSTNPSVRRYDSKAARDKALAMFRAGTEWAGPREDTRRGLPYRVGTGFDGYRDVKYDPQSAEEQFRLFTNKQFPTGFVITNSEDPGSHWQGTFGGTERGLTYLREFRSGELKWNNDYTDHSHHIGEEIFDPERETERLGFDAAQDDTAEEKLDALWDALLARAKELQWCEEFDAFAKANGAPDRLLMSKVRVTIELEVNSREPDDEDVSDAMEAWIDSHPRTVTNWEVIS